MFDENWRNRRRMRRKREEEGRSNRKDRLGHLESEYKKTIDQMATEKRNVKMR